MKDKIKLETSKETAEFVLDVLIDHQKGYSNDVPPERILKIREFINKLSENLSK